MLTVADTGHRPDEQTLRGKSMVSGLVPMVTGATIDLPIGLVATHGALHLKTSQSFHTHAPLAVRTAPHALQSLTHLSPFALTKRVCIGSGRGGHPAAGAREADTGRPLGAVTQSVVVHMFHPHFLVGVR